MTRHTTRMTIEDAEHYTPEERAAIIATYPAHERDARVKGIPQLGSGRIFPLADDVISVQPFKTPDYWPLLGALDFGWDHPTAAVKLAWDRDNDCVYVVNAYRVRQATPIIHAAALKVWGSPLRWAWPKDGRQHKGDNSGKALAELYRDQGMKLLPEPSQYEGNRGDGVEAGLMDMLDRMQTGRLKVFDHLNDWFEEFRLYHRKDGLVVKEHDDLMSATRYALMSLRYARPSAQPARQQFAESDYDNPLAPVDRRGRAQYAESD